MFQGRNFNVMLANNLLSFYQMGPRLSFSKLTMSLVNILIIKYGQYTNVFAEKHMINFCICKSYSHVFSATHIFFSAKIPVN